jgi:Zn-dependent metalloprotease
MPERKILCADFEEEKEALEVTGRYRVVGQTAIRAEPGWCWLRYEPRNDKSRPIKAFKAGSARGKVEYSRSRKVARRLFDVETPASKDSPRKIAERWLKVFATQLGIAKDLSGLKFERVKDSIFGKHALFQQHVGPTPISGAWVRVDIDADGRVFNLQNDLVPLAVLTKRGLGAVTMRGRLPGDEGKPIPQAKAEEIALAAILLAKGGRKKIIGVPELLYRPTDGDPRLSWKIVVRSTVPTREWRMFIDAFSGKVLWKRNVLKKAPARALVFDPNPVVALNTVKLSDRAAMPAGAYREVELRGLNGSGYLDGEFVSTRLTKKRVRRRNGDFRFRRKQRGFTETMVYFHIDRLQRHIQSLGFTNILNSSIPVNVAGQREDNSFYSPTEKMISFGTGGVDDAEDAETIVHEYGHAMQDSQVPGFGESAECGAMGEGFGDFMAASYFADWKPAWLRLSISSWDCIAFPGNPPALRRLDSNKKYPKDITGEVHDDGEIWSACLWQLRNQLGRMVAETLIISHHVLLNRWAGFEDAANALLTADKRLFGGRNQAAVREVFVARGILPNPRSGGRRAGEHFPI